MEDDRADRLTLIVMEHDLGPKKTRTLGAARAHAVTERAGRRVEFLAARCFIRIRLTPESEKLADALPPAAPTALISRWIRGRRSLRNLLREKSSGENDNEHKAGACNYHRIAFILWPRCRA